MQEIDPCDPEILPTLDMVQQLAHEAGQHRVLLQSLVRWSQFLIDNARWNEAELCISKTLLISIEHGDAAQIALLTHWSAFVAI